MEANVGGNGLLACLPPVYKVEFALCPPKCFLILFIKETCYPKCFLAAPPSNVIRSVLARVCLFIVHALHQSKVSSSQGSTESWPNPVDPMIPGEVRTSNSAAETANGVRRPTSNEYSCANIVSDLCIRSGAQLCNPRESTLTRDQSYK
jgi:hypothetical protein